MHRPHCPPVQVPAQTLWRKQSTLRDACLPVNFVDDKLEPRTAGHQHLGTQTQYVRPTNRLYSPEIERFAFDEM